jgi:hypothetical protein
MLLLVFLVDLLLDGESPLPLKIFLPMLLDNSSSCCKDTEDHHFIIYDYVLALHTLVDFLVLHGFILFTQYVE